MIGIDIGGTFTDVVLLTSDAVVVRKLLSSPSDYSESVATGAAAAAELGGVGLAELDRVVHATTVVTNAILEMKGVATGLLTTAGFRDVLEIGRLRRPSLYDLGWQKPPPLVRRGLRLEIDERIDAEGKVLRPLDEARGERTIEALVAAGVEAIAVCLLNSYVNPMHEQQLGEIIRRVAPNIHVSLSSSILPQVKEFERTSTTVIDAYVAPILDRYVRSLENRLASMDVSAPLLLMQSNGGSVPSSAATKRAVSLVESGPAAGALAVSVLSQQLGNRDMIGLDIGGTTAKACLVENGRVRETQEMEVGAGLNVESRLLRGGGYAICVPSVDLAEIGAGGGSIARVDSGGALKVGPESAGASPGPVCYGLGGTEPTLTDAFAVLGFIGSQGIAGGAQQIDVEEARRAISGHVGDLLGYSVEQAAWGIFLVGTATMIRAVRAVTTERGRDPRNLDIVAFGGAGPIHAAELARQLGVKRVLVPPLPGVFSSFGLLLADLRFDFLQPIMRRSIGLDDSVINQEFARLAGQAEGYLRDLGLSFEQADVEWALDMRYEGQSSELAVVVPPGTSADRIFEAFNAEHEASYGHRATDEVIVVVNGRMSVRLKGASSSEDYRSIVDLVSRGTAGPDAEDRDVYFGDAHGFASTPLIGRADLTDVARSGPLIIGEYDSTIVVPPGFYAAIDPLFNVVLTRGDAP